MSETAATEVLTTLKLSNVTEKPVELCYESVMFIPVEEVNNWHVSFRTDIDREAATTSVIIEAKHVHGEREVGLDCCNVCGFDGICNNIKMVLGKVTSVGGGFVLVICTWLK